MALVANKADLHEKREVPTQVSQIFIVIRSFLSAEYISRHLFIAIRSFLNDEYFLTHFLFLYMIEGWH